MFKLYRLYYIVGVMFKLHIYNTCLSLISFAFFTIQLIYNVILVFLYPISAFRAWLAVFGCFVFIFTALTVFDVLPLFVIFFCMPGYKPNSIYCIYLLYMYHKEIVHGSRL